ncbi:MAG TPA: hypothetical protein VL547_13965 [Dinghuibacter sp.]|jgi:hypothetical protein|uniref:hypothetical protein n=1 Tax=Dinghuibacter sp. TaxID=2024697 RepID=UPI002D1990AE|nr:hypothetical protein [Dinghuibacter sp.]HTJ13135.1 hypothetical protein [Dinghuibacter sp.]
MTPETFQHLVDSLDGQTPPPEAPDAETARQQRVLNYAVDAIRHDGLHRQVALALNAARAEAPGAARDTAGTAPAARVIPFYSKPLSIAAAVAILICLATAGKFILTSPKDIYDRYYSSYDIPTERGGEDLDPLEQAYQARNWSMTDHLLTGDASPRDRFLAGMAFMEQGQYAQAIGLFKPLTQGTLYKDESEYYLAMAYLASHQSAPALGLINRIKSDPDHLFHRQVMQMSGLDLLILRAK